MHNYKADVTLNEKDSLQDLLNLEKQMVKLYALAITEGVSKGFRTLIKKHLVDSVNDQIEVYFAMTEQGYYRVKSCDEEKLIGIKEKFSQVLTQLC